MAGGKTQTELYQEIDLELSWSEKELPQHQRTKHVHGLHPYLGKFIPQLVDVFLRRHFMPGDCVYDPFSGSATTLVEANIYNCGAIGCDISAFNVLLARVKTGEYAFASLERDLNDLLDSLADWKKHSTRDASTWLHTWFSERTLGELLTYKAAASTLSPQHRDVAYVILSRAARSARMTTHFDLDFPREPARAPYWCHKHKRTCQPVDEAEKFLRRYTVDTLRRLRAFSEIRSDRPVYELHHDSRTVKLPVKPDGIITSPPYPGLIDYHEQHRYAYELLSLEDRRLDEIGPAARGKSKNALQDYSDGIVATFRNAAKQMKPKAPVIIVVADTQELYPQILQDAGLTLEREIRRHVNRRTGRRAGEFFESILVCRTAG